MFDNNLFTILLLIVGQDGGTGHRTRERLGPHTDIRGKRKCRE